MAEGLSVEVGEGGNRVGEPLLRIPGEREVLISKMAEEEASSWKEPRMVEWRLKSPPIMKGMLNNLSLEISEEMAEVKAWRDVAELMHLR